MENSAANTDLIRGHVITIILRSLEGSDKYGYEICREIEVKSEGSYVLKQPTLYSCLKRLESQEYITSYWGEISNGGRRRYYSLTEKGKEYLERDKQEWEFSRTLINRLLSDKDYDLTSPPPFNPSELRPYTRKMNEFSQMVQNAEIAESEEPVLESNSEETKAEASITPEVINEISVQESVSEEESQKVEEVVEEIKAESVQESQAVESTPEKPQQLDIFAALDMQEKEEEENSDVNYKNAFSRLFDTPKDTPPAPVVEEAPIKKEEESSEIKSGLPSTISELKKRYYSEGFNLKPYSFSNVVIYYNMNYVYANKINLITYWLTYAFLLVQIGLIRLLFGTAYNLTDGLYLGAILGGLIIPGVPTVSYLLNPLKRVKADFDFKTSLINRSLLCLNLIFIFACLGVFVWQVNLQELSTMVLPIFIPIILLLNFPLSSIIYNQIYKTKKFHLT